MFNDSFIDSPLGKAAMDYAEQVYSSSFKCGEFTIKTNPEMRQELIDFHMQPVYEIQECSQYSIYTEEDFEIPDPQIICEGLSKEDAEKMVDSSVYVWLCNYKGEGEGFTLKEFAENLQTYNGKWDYS